MIALYAPDSYGGFLSSPGACRRVSKRLEAHGFELRLHPMADGGEGTMAALRHHRPVQLVAAEVRGPYGDRLLTAWARDAGAAVIESARAIGLQQSHGRREPLHASSAGLGDLMRRAAQESDGPLMVGLGGTATVDGGLGALVALGLHALDETGRAIDAPDGAALARVRRLVGAPPLGGRLVQVLCDVRDLFGDAPRRYGPQKGLKPDEIESGEAAFERWADVLDAWRSDQGRAPMDRDAMGGGAAGGLAYALAAALDAPLAPGAAVFGRMTGLDASMAGADAVVVGEGRLDATSFHGKVPGDVAARARARGARVAALVGAAEDVPPPPLGPDAVFAGGPGLDRDAAFDRATDELGAWIEGTVQ